MTEAFIGTLVVTFPDMRTKDQMHRVREIIKEAIPDVHVVCIAGATSCVFIPEPIEPFPSDPDVP